MKESIKSLQLLTSAAIFLTMASCGAIKVEPVEEGDSLRYHARVGYFLHPPQTLKTKYIKDTSIYADNKDFKRCEPSSIVRLHARFERRYLEVKQGQNIFLFDTIAGKPIELVNGKYILVDKYFKKDFPLPTAMVKRLGEAGKKSQFICQGKVWVGMSTDEFLIARPPADNIIKKRQGKIKLERWQYESKNHFLSEYQFANGILQKHSDPR